MKAGDTVVTPRFCTVRIKKVFETKKDAFAEGFVEPTHYEGGFDVFGKSIDLYHMEFAAVVER